VVSRIKHQVLKLYEIPTNLNPAEWGRDHRPWPFPDRPWAMAMVWHDLLFAHWIIDPEALKPLIPAPLQLDTFNGYAYVGIVPFRMSGVRLRVMPDIPGFHAFPELNVRTYVTDEHGEKAGVLFFSLDATNALAVHTARKWYCLPYYRARMSCLPKEDGSVEYRSFRTHRAAVAAEFDATYSPTGDVFNATSGTLDYFLTERYCLYSYDTTGCVFQADIHHPPWPLQRAEAEIRFNTMTNQINLKLPDEKPLLHFARHQPVVAWRPVLFCSPGKVALWETLKRKPA
jgi:uncharacterized protein